MREFSHGMSAIHYSELDSRSTQTQLLHQSPRSECATPTAVIYCENNFGQIEGRTANGLVRHSEKYRILSVIDSTKTGRDSGEVLNGRINNIPVCRDLDDALANASFTPDYFILGMAPSTGLPFIHEKKAILEAMSHGMLVVNGLHENLNDDPLFSAAISASNVKILNIRNPRPMKALRSFSGRIAEVDCPRIAILGTDCAIGKRMTATLLTKALNRLGIKTVMVSTGQTGLLQGSRYGIALDAIPSQFCIGELEATIVAAFENERPDVIVIEGQGSLSHPAFSTTSAILRGSRASAVILQHAPARTHRCNFDDMPMPTAESEIAMIEAFANTRVIGLTINHDDMSSDDVNASIDAYERKLGIPVADALSGDPAQLTRIVTEAFPSLHRPGPVLA